jgi:hypothetical protein
VSMRVLGLLFVVHLRSLDRRVLARSLPADAIV